ncbi:MAG: DivIVA domain-containing protein [Actinomycetota bacterium]
MSATELDLPVLMAAEQIRRREFVTIRRGYDPDQVRDYLDQLADQVDLMASMIREARLDAESAIRAGASPKTDPYEQLARRVASVIREADDVAERTRSEASRDAERSLEQARTDADRIRLDAQTHAEQAREEAERSVHEAREQADRTIAGLATRREALVGQLSQMQERLIGVARDLEDAIVMPEIATDSPTDVGWVAPAGSPGEGTAGSFEIVDVRTGDEPPALPAGAPLIASDDVFAGLDDPSYEELWDGAESIHLEMPDIPPLDLSWDSDEDDPQTT